MVGDYGFPMGVTGVWGLEWLFLCGSSYGFHHVDIGVGILVS